MANNKIDRSKARLDRSARRGQPGFVLCHYCNGRLAELRLIPDIVATEPPFPEILVPETMVADKDGIFRTISHNWQGRARIRRFYKNTRWLKAISKSEYARLKVKRFPRLPATVECPQCGQLQIFDPDVLGISLEDLPPINPPMTPEELAQTCQELTTVLRKYMGEKGADEETIERECRRLMAEFELEDREAAWDMVRGELLVIRDNDP